MKTAPAQEAVSLFQKKFGRTPTHRAQAPGRLELIGNHTDYNQGLVMALAVDKYIQIAADARTDGRIELASSAFTETEKFSVSDIVKNPAASWANYVKGVLLQLRERGVGFSGFNAAIHGNLPIGAGMSSSAALEVATALIIRQLFPYALTETGLATPPTRDGHGQLPPLPPAERLALAKICQAAENKFVGVQCGLLDQISSLFGQAFHAIMIDCQELSVERVPMIGEVAVVVCNSGVKHALVGGEYNELRQQCEGAAKALGVRALRAVDPAMLKANRAKLTPRQYECAYHIVGENFRVEHGDKALRAGDFAQFGHFMFQSHESSRDSFKNSAPELDLLVEIARAHPAIYGARLMGGGFGGATINLVQRGSVDLFMEYMAAEYARRSGVTIEPMLCQIVDGAE
ncbi:MAG TPA: galactokinase [Verrucomicrobiae bacterium]|jgi:galactokinase|nr:galactokinase [Verrucomicrobiae bacterium]